MARKKPLTAKEQAQVAVFEEQKELLRAAGRAANLLRRTKNGRCRVCAKPYYNAHTIRKYCSTACSQRYRWMVLHPPKTRPPKFGEDPVTGKLKLPPAIRRHEVQAAGQVLDEMHANREESRRLSLDTPVDEEFPYRKQFVFNRAAQQYGYLITWQRGKVLPGSVIVRLLKKDGKDIFPKKEPKGKTVLFRKEGKQFIREGSVESAPDAEVASSPEQEHTEHNPV
jgi:hypothetical protein